MFTVKSASKDRKAPVIKKISINKNTVSPGAKVTITCEIQDDSELNLDPERSYLYMKNKSQISQPFVFVKIEHFPADTCHEKPAVVYLSYKTWGERSR